MVDKKNLKSVNCSLKKFTSSNDSIIVTEWVSGEGWTIQIGDNKVIDLNAGELAAINYLTAMIDYDF